MPYTQLFLWYNRATTIPHDGSWTTTTAYPLPDWAPEIAFIGTTHEAECVRASTSGTITGGLGAAPALVRLRQASKKAYRIEEVHRNDAKTYYTVILNYRSIGELKR